MTQLHRDLKRWEDHETAIRKRNPYGGQDDLTGRYHEQLFPVNDIMCVNCAKYYYNKGRNFMTGAKIIKETGLCRFCGQNYELPSDFIEVHIMVGKDSMKGPGILDATYNTQETRELNKKIQEKKLREMELKRYR